MGGTIIPLCRCRGSTLSSMPGGLANDFRPKRNGNLPLGADWQASLTSGVMTRLQIGETWLISGRVSSLIRTPSPMAMSALRRSNRIPPTDWVYMTWPGTYGNGAVTGMTEICTVREPMATLLTIQSDRNKVEIHGNRSCPSAVSAEDHSCATTVTVPAIDRAPVTVAARIQACLMLGFDVS